MDTRDSIELAEFNCVISLLADSEPKEDLTVSLHAIWRCDDSDRFSGRNDGAAQLSDLIVASVSG